MKKRFLLLFILFLIPIAYAKLSITSDVKNFYNLGDSISSSVSIIAEKDISGVLKLVLNCNNQSFDYYTSPIELKANQQKSIEVPDKKISSLMSGSCIIDAVLNSDTNELIDSTSSKSFSVTNSIEVIFTLNKKTFLPGEKLIISGEIKPSFNDEIKSANMQLKLDDIHITIALKSLKFNYETTLAKTIKSKEQNVEIILNDSFGNNGNNKDGFYVNPVQSKLELSLNYTSFLPEEIIDIKPLLHDQANDLIAENTLVEISKGMKKIFSEETIEGIKFTIPKYSSPGMYRITVKSSKLKTEARFNVEEEKALDGYLDGQFLILTNIGNVNYYDLVAISFAGEKSFVKDKKVYLKPSQSINVDLGELTDSGKYIINVLGKTFENVEITAKAKFNFNILYWILAILIIILLILIFRIRHKGKKFHLMKHEREFKKGREFGEQLKLKRKPIQMDTSDFRRRMLMSNEKEEKSNVSVKPRGQYFEIIANENQEIGNQEYKEINQADKKGRGLFGMFD